MSERKDTPSSRLRVKTRRTNRHAPCIDSRRRAVDRVGSQRKPQTMRDDAMDAAITEANMALTMPFRRQERFPALQQAKRTAETQARQLVEVAETQARQLAGTVEQHLPMR